MEKTIDAIIKCLISDHTLPLINAVISFAALLAALCIPKKIMLNQQFATLVEQYRSSEMGFAIYSLFHFFEHHCGNDPERISDEYTKRFDRELKNPMNDSKNDTKQQIDPSKTLHFQRRLVAYFYWDLSKLAFEQRFTKVKRRKLKQMVEGNERRLISLVLHMSKAASECFVDSSHIGEPPDDDEVTMNRLLKRLYDTTEGWDNE